MISNRRCSPIRPEPRTSATCFRLHAEEHDDPSIQHHLPALRHRQDRNHANRCVPLLLRLHRVRRDAAAEAGRLLCVLLVWLGALSADSGSTRGRPRHGLLLREVNAMSTTSESSRDWLASARTNVLAWWLPRVAMVAALFAAVR